jgi:predicted amidohydrolase YtcJ
MSKGFQVNMHAIGDYANHLALNAVEKAYETLLPNISREEAGKLCRARIEHAQIIVSI